MTESITILKIFKALQPNKMIEMIDLQTDEPVDKKVIKTARLFKQTRPNLIINLNTGIKKSGIEKHVSFETPINYKI